MISVVLQPRVPVYRPQSGAPLLTETEMSRFSQKLTLFECKTIDLIVEAEGKRRGFYHLRTESPRYKALEACVVADVVAMELDLGEIGAQIEEARWSSS